MIIQILLYSRMKRKGNEVMSILIALLKGRGREKEGKREVLKCSGAPE